MSELNHYTLSRPFWDFAFDNPEKISPNHCAIFYFAIEHCNRLGWKKKFGFPTQMVMDAIGIKKHQTYIRYFNDLCEWGFFNLIEKSKNQYSANIISLQSAMLKKGKALDKAIVNHAAKQTETIGQSNGQSNSSIDKPYNHTTKEPLEPNNSTKTPFEKTFDKFEQMRKEIGKPLTETGREIIIRDLDRLADGNESLEIKILEQSIVCNYPNVYKLNDNLKQSKQPRKISPI